MFMNKYSEEYEKIIFQKVGILQCVYRSFQRHARCVCLLDIPGWEMAVHGQAVFGSRTKLDMDIPYRRDVGYPYH